MADRATWLSELEMQSLANGLQRFMDEYKKLVTLEALRHVSAAIVVLESIAPLGHQPLSLDPRPRVCGLCPCEMSDMLKGRDT